jgi:alcohol dehydrogenase
MSNWSFHLPTRIVFGDDSLDSIGQLIQADEVVLITTQGFVKRGVVDQILESMVDSQVKVFPEVRPNPDVKDIEAMRDRVMASSPDLLLALGGGSSIDTAKALARLTTNPDTKLLDHLKKGEDLRHNDALPLVAIPTTAGTGSEVTPFGTIWDRESCKKWSIEGNDLFPSLALLDPKLTLDLSADMTVFTGLDAMSHAFESIWNRNASPLTISLATRSLKLSFDSLPKLKANGRDLSARRNMMEASLLAGMAISQTKTALAHSISYPLTLTFDMPHGLACGFALPETLKFNAVHDDGRLKLLSSELGYGNVQEMEVALKSFLVDLDAGWYLLSFVQELSQMIEACEDMIEEGRLENNMRPVDQEDVNHIFEGAMLRFKAQIMNMSNIDSYQKSI